MGRDAKPFLNPETPRPAFPLPRRTSLTGSFSLPTLSLSSRSKATPPSLPPLDIKGAGGHPLDDVSTSSSCITPSSSQPFPSSSTEPQTRPSSPLKPPTSPGSSVPLPSIRSLRSRFSFSSGSQDQTHTPRATPTPQKRVTSRRFLPFGNSNTSASTNNATPTVPRKSLGDVFALGRSSTSSRLDATSTRSGTPSSRSSRSVTSAATLRGWGSTSKHLEPGAPHSRLSFGRPRSHDYTLDTDLGFVVAIGAPDETIRQRPAVSTSNSSPLILGATLSVEESSQEDITTSSLGDAATRISLPDLAQTTVSESTPRNSSSRPKHPADSGSAPSARPSARQSPLPPIKIPLPLDLKSATEVATEQEKAPIIPAESEEDWENPAPTAYTFAPVDDRSDVTSSTHNTPSSARKSSHETQAIIPALPSPSPFRSLPGELVVPAPFGNNPTSSSLVASEAPGLDHVATSDVGMSTRWVSPEKQLPTSLSPSKSIRREHAVMGLLGELDGALAAFRSVQQQAQSESRVVDPEKSSAPAESHVGDSLEGSLKSSSAATVSHVLSEFNPPAQAAFLETKAALQRHQERIGQLLSSLDTAAVNGDHNIVLPIGESARLTRQQDVHPASTHQPSNIREDPISVAQPLKNSDWDGHLHALDSDLIKLLSPHRLSHVSHSAPNSALVPTIALPPASPRYSSQPLPSGSRTPQPSPDSRAGPGSRYPASTPSPSSASFRPSDIQLPPRPHHLGPSIVSNGRGYHSAKNSPVLSKATLVSSSPAGLERNDSRDFSSPLSGYSRTAIQRSPSVSAAMTRKRSASFDLSGSTTFTRDSSDPFVTPHSSGPRRTDWLGPRTAKAFAAAGLLESTREKEHSIPVPGARSDSPRGVSWRAQQSDLNGRAGNVRSHSRLGSEVISPSSRARALTNETDSSPGYRRGSLDHTAPPSPVSTHRTLVSSATSSSQSQQSVLQALRERHELETEALLLALAGSKKSERDLRVENEQLLLYIGELEHRIATLEDDRDQEKSKWGLRERTWDSPSAGVDALDRRRQDILVGRPARAWSAHNRVKSIAANRPHIYGSNRISSSPNETRRPATAVGMFRNSDFDQTPRSATPPTKRSVWVDPVPISRTNSASPRVPTMSMLQTTEISSDTSTELEKWHDELFAPPSESHMRRIGSQALPNNSATSLIPQLPGSMSLLVQEAGPLSEDEYSFGSASPSSLTLVQPRNSTPKPCPPANISPVTAEFSFNSMPGSPRSLRLRPEEEIHLADLISLQGLEITDVLDDTD